MAKRSMGIDLGTSNSAAAIVEDGSPRVIANDWGEILCASVVTFAENGATVVGNPAKAQIVTNPASTVYSAKRLIGRTFYSAEASEARDRVGYSIVEGPNASVEIKIHGQRISVPEVSAHIIRELKANVEGHLKHPVESCVITVPAFFNDVQRQATKDAGRLAGLEVSRIINEPTAAALAYGYGKSMEARLAVYDLGGGTFDISILQIAGDIFEVLSTSGDTYLGGDDFDKAIADWILESVHQGYALDLRNDTRAMQRIRDKAEETKLVLSEDDSTVVTLNHLGLATQEGGINFSGEIDRHSFSSRVMPLVQRSFQVCDEALSQAGFGVADLDGVILVGGSTRMPIIRSAVSEYFNREVHANVDPDLVVAMGAAIQADELETGAGQAVLLDVVSQTLRVGTVENFTEPVIERNTTIPIERTRRFVTGADNQDRVNIRIYQGEGREIEDCIALGEFEISGLREAKRGEVTIEVVFSLDANAILSVQARDVDTGQSASTTIRLDGAMTQQVFDEARERIEAGLPDLSLEMPSLEGGL